MVVTVPLPSSLQASDRWAGWARPGCHGAPAAKQGQRLVVQREEEALQSQPW